MIVKTLVLFRAFRQEWFLFAQKVLSSSIPDRVHTQIPSAVPVPIQIRVAGTGAGCHRQTASFQTKIRPVAGVLYGVLIRLDPTEVCFS